VLYNSATSDEKREIEAASLALGRLPMKGPSGLEWKTLLDPAVIEEATLARAEVSNPDVAQRIRELTEIREMTITFAGVALSEI